MKISTKQAGTALIRRLIDQVNASTARLLLGKGYRLEAILRPEFWGDEDESHHAPARAFSHLVGDQPTPFEDAGWTGDRHNKYRYMP